VWILMPKEESKNAVNVTYGMFRGKTGRVMRILDNQMYQKALRLGT